MYFIEISGLLLTLVHVYLDRVYVRHCWGAQWIVTRPKVTYFVKNI